MSRTQGLEAMMIQYEGFVVGVGEGNAFFLQPRLEDVAHDGLFSPNLD